VRLNELLREVDTMRPFVGYRLRGRPNDIDSVLQHVREVVWHRAARYDANRGTPNAFVFGITRNVVRSTLGRAARTSDGLPDELESDAFDPLTALVHRFDVYRWMTLVADFVGEADWSLVAELALSDGAAADILAGHSLSSRSLRTVRDRVSLVAYTVRAALAAVDAETPLTGAALVHCVPERGGLREVAAMIGTDATTIAETLQLHPGAARARIATAKRLLTIAYAVIHQDGAP
jgi:DNA-directed RNA polymerase specialized sigma24 family protein